MTVPYTPRDDFVFLPLGGAGEIGMNMNLYGCAGKWLIVDCGVTFADDTTPPNIDLIMPDPSYLAGQEDRIVGLVVTHAHEDHVGAVAHLWPRLRCPVYATPFTVSVLKNKLAEAGLLGRVPVHTVPLKSTIELDPFKVELVTLTHSIPEPNAVLVTSPVGTVLHTGDWKLDPDPLVGEAADMDELAKLADRDILAMVCDSTNVFTPGWTGSEAKVRESLTALIARYDRKVAVTCFASNVARLESIAVAAHAADREVCLVGRSLDKMAQAARDNGYLRELREFLSPEEAGYLPDEKVCYITTGSQGEARAALSRIASNQHKHVSLGEGDVVIFSSRVIPGNERPIFRLQNLLARHGVEIVTEKEHFVHVSGHPAREELAHLYSLVKPRYSIPVHGELRHLQEHARMAREEWGVSGSVVVENGGVVRLGPGPLEIIAEVETGRLVLDGQMLTGLDSEIMRTRKRGLFNGTAVVSLVVDSNGRLMGDPRLSAPGLVDPTNRPEEHRFVIEAVVDALADLSKKERRDDAAVEEAARIAVRRALRDIVDRKPVTDVHLTRI